MSQEGRPSTHELWQQRFSGNKDAEPLSEMTIGRKRGESIDGVQNDSQTSRKRTDVRPATRAPAPPTAAPARWVSRVPAPPSRPFWSLRTTQNPPPLDAF